MSSMTRIQPMRKTVFYRSACEALVFSPESWEDTIREKFKNEEGSFFIWLFEAVYTGKIIDGRIVWPGTMPAGHTKEITENLVKLRVFSNTKEWYLWRTGPGQFQNRFRTDEEGNEHDTLCVDSQLVLRGNIAKLYGKKEIVTRNYIDFENHQAGYFDYRFLELKK